ncbi:hypothetical protein ACOIHK_08995 [Klebsiella pneumoniae]|uniref:hypothetical protein n=1 Tax=Klebsiella TaxID=570 RepID=UPI000F51AC83|nr:MULTISPECIES: hypothetical protein [Klebsiella]HBR1004850.1 hypothetical protein [Klebsiella quasipneumoniae subsp. quasipneumoniae]EKV4336603.1 hypothetical protein [Klebsiella pneumoniae]EKY7550611.1 hypothetical protein [Klebsiella pneumoniae]MBZ1715618.1 hypothetical protein [Klebsiella pneumoniae]MCF1907860.1 hypothetical protein [Klebsiella pneumoniae]
MQALIDVKQEMGASYPNPIPYLRTQQYESWRKTQQAVSEKGKKALNTIETGHIKSSKGRQNEILYVAKTVDKSL